MCCTSRVLAWSGAGTPSVSTQGQKKINNAGDIKKIKAHQVTVFDNIQRNLILDKFAESLDFHLSCCFQDDCKPSFFLCLCTKSLNCKLESIELYKTVMSPPTAGAMWKNASKGKNLEQKFSDLVP